MLQRSTFITLSHAENPDFPEANLVDDRAGTLFKFLSSQTDPFIDLNLGPSHGGPIQDTDGIDRLIIPANHNISALYVEQDTVANFASPDPLHATSGSPDTSPVPGTLIDIEFDTKSSDEQYIRVGIIGTDTYQIPQLILTKVATFTAGPDLADSRDEKVANVARQIQPTGLSPTVQLGPDQRVIEYEYPLIEDADLTAMELLINDVGMSFPFWVDPASFSTPPEDDEPVLWMKFASMPNSSNTVLVPSSQSRSKSFSMRLIESLD